MNRPNGRGTLKLQFHNRFPAIHPCLSPCNFIQSTDVFFSFASTIYTDWEKDARNPHFFSEILHKRFVTPRNCVIIHIEIPCILLPRSPEAELKQRNSALAYRCGKLQLKLHNQSPLSRTFVRVRLLFVPLFSKGT